MDDASVSSSWPVTPAEQSQWFLITSMWLPYSRAHCLISDPHILFLSTVHIWIVSTTTDALLCPLSSSIMPLWSDSLHLSVSLSLSNSNSISFLSLSEVWLTAVSFHIIASWFPSLALLTAISHTGDVHLSLNWLMLTWNEKKIVAYSLIPERGRRSFNF